MGRKVIYKQAYADELMEKFDKAYKDLKESGLEISDTMGYLQDKLNLTDRDMDIIVTELNDQFMKSKGWV